MLDFQAIRLLHRHENGQYAPMVERAEPSADTNDPERRWSKGRIFACEMCADEVLVQTAVDTSGNAPNPAA